MSPSPPPPSESPQEKASGVSGPLPLVVLLWSVWLLQEACKACSSSALYSAYEIPLHSGSLPSLVNSNGRYGGGLRWTSFRPRSSSSTSWKMKCWHEQRGWSVLGPMCLCTFQKVWHFGRGSCESVQLPQCTCLAYLP